MHLPFVVYKISVYGDDVNLLDENINTTEQHKSPYVIWNWFRSKYRQNQTYEHARNQNVSQS
jgi:hypothetical protein